MTTGDIATWVIFAVIVIGFLFGLKRIYHNFSSGKCDSCGTKRIYHNFSSGKCDSCGTNNGCSGGCHCDCCGTDNKLTSKVKDKQH